MQMHAFHYASSTEPLGTSMLAEEFDSCPRVSAGHERHEYTTGFSWPKIKV